MYVSMYVLYVGKYVCIYSLLVGYNYVQYDLNTCTTHKHIVCLYVHGYIIMDVYHRDTQSKIYQCDDGMLSSNSIIQMPMIYSIWSKQSAL